MIVDYSGFSCTYDASSNTYSRPSVSVKYPCSKCGSNRPLKEGTLIPDVCPCRTETVDIGKTSGSKKGGNQNGI